MTNSMQAPVAACQVTSHQCGELTWPTARGAARCCRKAGGQDGALCEPPAHGIFRELPWDRDHHSVHFWWAATTLHNGHNLPKAFSQDCTKDFQVQHQGKSRRVAQKKTKALSLQKPFASRQELVPDPFPSVSSGLRCFLHS